MEARLSVLIGDGLVCPVHSEPSPEALVRLGEAGFLERAKHLGPALAKHSREGKVHLHGLLHIMEFFEHSGVTLLDGEILGGT
jgi:hypothetical protein